MISAIIGLVGMVAAFILGRRTAAKTGKSVPHNSIDESAQMKRDFVANVSHELKTPITLIQGFIETLRNGAIEDRETALEFLAIMDTHTTQMTTIINDLLELSKIEFHESHRSLKLVPTVINPLVESAIRSAHLRYPQFPTPQFDSTHEFNIRIAPGLAEQAIYNLIENALVHGGAERAIQIQIQIKKQKSEVRLSVIDHGGGIEPEHQSRIFERFYQADPARTRNRHGSGLGLAIVKHIMKLHNGRIELNSEVGKGSTFSLVFPN